MDLIDQKILRQLEINARQSRNGIARRLGISKTLVSYRLNRLEQRGIINGYQYLSNQAALGQLSFGLLIKFHGLFAEEEAQIVDHMKHSRQFNWAVAVSGRWDAMAVVIEADILSFNRVMEDFFRQYGRHVKEYNFYIDYKGYISGHNYLYNDLPINLVSYSNDAQVSLTAVENQVLKALQRNPMLSMPRLAKQLAKTFDTVQVKHQSLVKMGILLKAVPKINHDLLGWQNTICLMSLAPQPERVAELVEYCNNLPNITRVAHCLGHINLIINVHSRNARELKESLGGINKKFSDVIVGCDLIQTVDKPRL